MAGPQTIYPIAITADDKTAKGVASATKRVSGVTRNAQKANLIAAEATDRAWRRSGYGLVRTFGAVESASARALGSRSLGSTGIVNRLGALREAASAAGSGLGEAATAGGVLEGALTGVGVVAGATIGVLAAAGFAAFKLADGWAKGARNLSNLADTIGVATKDLQAFTAAGERVGVDKGASSGALGGLAQTLNDARYGRNNEAVALLGRLGVRLKMNADGSVDTMGMLPAIADAIARQKNAQTRRRVAGMLGIGDAALPMFLQGSGALRADMADAAKNAPSLTAADIVKGRRIARKGAIVGQMAERAHLYAGSLAADLSERGYDLAISGGHGILGGSQSFGSIVRGTFAPAAEKIERAADKMVSAVGGFIGGVTGAIGGYLGAVARVESGNNPNARAGSSSAVGLYQFTKGTWLDVVKRHGASVGLGWEASQIVNGRYGPTIRDPATLNRVLALRSNPRISTALAAAYTRDTSPALAAALGRQPGAGDLYMGHFLGPSGAARFFRYERRNPDASAAALFPREAAANRNIFFDRSGHARSMSQVHELMGRKIEIALKVEAAPGTRVTAQHGHAVAISHAPVGHH